MAIKKSFYRINEIRDGINNLYESGVSKGKLTGFETLNDFYTFKLGACTYIGSAPTSGKTEWIFEMQMNLSEKYGWKHVVFSPETGTKEEIAAELISKYLRKPFYKNYHDCMTEQELFKAQAWLDEHFFIIDTEDEDLTVENFLKIVDEIEQTYSVTIQTTLGDPFNEFKHDFSEDNGRQDIYIERILGVIRRNAKSKRRHNIIITHCRDQQSVLDKDSGMSYYPPPTARDFAGGQAWFRKGMGMIVIYRPPLGMNDENGYPYKDNEVHILIRKAKPKGIGKVGKVVLYYDWRANRYYEVIDGRQKYSWGKNYKGEEEKEPTPIKQLLTTYSEPAPF